MDKPNDKQTQIANLQNEIEELKRIKELKAAIATGKEKLKRIEELKTAIAIGKEQEKQKRIEELKTAIVTTKKEIIANQEKLKRIKELKAAITTQKELIANQEKVNKEDEYKDIQNANVSIIDDTQEMKDMSINMEKNNQKKLNLLETKLGIIETHDYASKLEEINKKINKYNKELELRKNILIAKKNSNKNIEQDDFDDIKKTERELNKAKKIRDLLEKIIANNNKKQQKLIPNIEREILASLNKAKEDLKNNKKSNNNIDNKINLIKQIIKLLEDKNDIEKLKNQRKELIKNEQEKIHLLEEKKMLEKKIVEFEANIENFKKVTILEYNINKSLSTFKEMYEIKKEIFNTKKDSLTTKNLNILLIELQIIIKNIIKTKMVLGKDYENIDKKIEAFKNLNDNLNYSLTKLIQKPNIESSPLQTLPILEIKAENKKSNYIPIIELYEYGLFGSMMTQKLSKLVDTEGCGKIELAKIPNIQLFNMPTKNEPQDGYKKGVRCSCDLFNSSPVPQAAGFTNNELNSFNDKFQKAYMNYSMKRPVSEILQYNGRDMSYNDIIKIFDKAIITCKEFLAQYDPTINSHTDPNPLLAATNILNYHQGAVLLKMKVYKTTKIIVFGDFHGSFHTFFRHMERLMKMKIINKKTFEIQDNYILIFLGDIVDRGTFSLEILLFISILILRNNNPISLKIIYNRGNHEEISTNIEDFIGKEIRKKFPNNSEFSAIKDKIYKLHTYLPSAIIVEMEDKRLWLSHGCFPIANLGSNIVAETFKETFFTSSSVYETEFFKKNDDHDFDNFFGIPNQIRWNDVNIEGNDTLKNINRNAGIKLGPNIIRDIMRLNNLTMIIRGHQDTINNSWLYSEGLNKIYKLDTLTNEDIPNIIKYNNNFVDNNKEQVIGPIAKINGNGASWDSRSNLLPVLTISTNTDIGRNLTKDSYIIINFENTKKK